MGIFDGILKDGVSVLGSSIGGLAKDIRTAITGKEALTAEERKIILEKTNEMEKLSLEADLAINQGQMKINEIEAQSSSIFKSGWRPGTGWLCLSGLAYQTLIVPLLPWFANILSHTLFAIFPKVIIFSHHVPALPSVDTGTLVTILLAMLGLGGFRTYEKTKGISK